MDVCLLCIVLASTHYWLESSRGFLSLFLFLFFSFFRGIKFLETLHPRLLYSSVLFFLWFGGGFSSVYRCIGVYLGVPRREERRGLDSLVRSFFCLTSLLAISYVTFRRGDYLYYLNYFCMVAFLLFII